MLFYMSKNKINAVFCIVIFKGLDIGRWFRGYMSKWCPEFQAISLFGKTVRCCFILEQKESGIYARFGVWKTPTVKIKNKEFNTKRTRNLTQKEQGA